jgi:hypothetical protein
MALVHTHRHLLEKPCILAGPPGFYVGSGEKKRPHVVAWENANGREVPPGYEVHHICEEKACIEETHLELLTEFEHKSRHALGNRHAAGNAGPNTPEWRAKLSTAGKGQVWTTERRRKQSEAQKRRFARERAAKGVV